MTTIVGLYLSRRGSEARARERERGEEREEFQGLISSGLEQGKIGGYIFVYLVEETENTTTPTDYKYTYIDNPTSILPP